MKLPADWPAGEIYEALSRLPWLTALAAWNSGTTYTRGLHFTENPADTNVGAPDVGDATPCVERYGLCWTSAEQFSVEHRRGWRESGATPPRAAGGPWDEKRNVEMVKKQPGGVVTLHVEGAYAGYRSGDPSADPPLYWTSSGDDMALLEAVQWADWSSSGRLLVATSDGRLQTRSLRRGTIAEVADLGKLVPQPTPPPDWATDW